MIVNVTVSWLSTGTCYLYVGHPAVASTAKHVFITSWLLDASFEYALVSIDLLPDVLVSHDKSVLKRERTLAHMNYPGACSLTPPSKQSHTLLCRWCPCRYCANHRDIQKIWKGLEGLLETEVVNVARGNIVHNAFLCLLTCAVVEVTICPRSSIQYSSEELVNYFYTATKAS